MTTRLSLIVFMVVALQLGHAFGADNAYVDLQKALLSCDTGKKAKSVLTEIASGYERGKDEREVALKSLKNEVEKQSSMTDATRASKVKEYEYLLEQYKTFLKNAQADLQSTNDKLTIFIINGLVDVTKEYYSSTNFSGIYALDANAGQLTELIAGKLSANVNKGDSVDITGRVLEAFNLKTVYYDSIIAKAPYLLPIEGIKYSAVLEKTDSTAPVIAISAPKAGRGEKLTTRERSITVAGKATSASGVADVKINRQPAALDAEGNFSAEVALTVGDNEITVVVIDGNINETTERFTVVRPADAE